MHWPRSRFVSSSAAPLEVLLRVSRSPYVPVWESVVLVQVGVVVPKEYWLQQSGIPSPFPSVSSEGLTAAAVSGGGGPSTPGWNAPPKTSCVVSTTVPL